MKMITMIPLEVLLVLLPMFAGIVSFIWPKSNKFFGISALLCTLFLVAGLAFRLLESGTYYHLVGGWGAPLGINLYVDGLSFLMLTITAVVGTATSIYATKHFTFESATRFWPIWLFMIAALNALFLSQDIFNFYVSLELIGLASVALTALSNTAASLTSAMRYLLVTLLGSLAYLLGVVLLYHGFGSVDLTILSNTVESIPVLWAAMALMSVGLLLKSALFPLHFWLPSTHASAPSPVSAVLSALIIKASLYILLRLWLYIFSAVGDIYLEVLFGFLGSAAILWGSIQALLQTRLKLLIAYSTVAQIGYLFVAFSLAIGGMPMAWNAVVYLILSHALAKSAMFLVSGNLLYFGGHDRIVDLDRIAQRLPLSTTAFALAGVSIIGLPLSGGFIGKWFLLEASIMNENWAFTIIIIIGSLLTAGYVFKVLGFAFTKASVPHEAKVISPYMEWAPLFLAIMAIIVGFFAMPLVSLVNTGNPFEIIGVQP